ncbi:MAG: hypothetical protein ACK4NR_09975 [Micavibrio sp.]
MEKSVNFIRSLQDEEAARYFDREAAGFIACYQNPCDLCPAVQGIMARIEAVSQNLREGQKLIVLMGETHTISSHRMLQAQLIAQLHDRQLAEGGLAVGVELPHDFMAIKMREMGVKALPAAVQPYFDRRLESLRLVSAYVDDNPLVEAPLTKEFLLNMIGVRDVSLRFNDVAITYKSQDNMLSPCLNTDDAITAAFAMDEAGVDLRQENIFCADALGMKLRNRFMAGNINRHLSDMNADIYIQLAGSAHVMGDHEEGLYYKDSLHKLLKDQGHEVINVLPVEGGWLGLHYWQHEMLGPQAHEQGLPDTLVIADMLRTRFNDCQAEAERKAIRDILRHSEAHDLALPIHDKKWKRQLASFRTALPQWLAEAQKAYVQSTRQQRPNAVSPRV